MTKKSIFLILIFSIICSLNIAVFADNDIDMDLNTSTNNSSSNSTSNIINFRLIFLIL